MTELFVILVATVLVNNFVLMRFLGLCPFMGVSRNLEAATGMSLATAFVLTLSSATAYLLHTYVLVPLDLEYLRTIAFILVNKKSDGARWCVGTHNKEMYRTTVV